MISRVLSWAISIGEAKRQAVPRVMRSLVRLFCLRSRRLLLGPDLRLYLATDMAVDDVAFGRSLAT